MEAGFTENRRGALLAAPPQWVWGTGAVGPQRSRLAGRARAGALPGAADRRCDQLELGPLRGARRDAVQHGGAVGIHREKRANGGRLHRSPFDVRGATETGREPGATARSRPADATWASLTAAGHRFDSGAFATS